MSSRSYVGVLDPDGCTYHVRYVHFDGDPQTMPFVLAAVWARTFCGDTAAAVVALLTDDWEQIGSDVTGQTPPTLPGYRPVPGVGMAFPREECPPQPTTGILTEPADPAAPRWMYLIDLGHPHTLLLLTNAGTWTITGRLELPASHDVGAYPTHPRPVPGPASGRSDSR